MALTHCDWCHHEVPGSNFCIRCGHELGTRTDAPRGALSGVFSGVFSGVQGAPPTSISGVRRRFAANPDESVLRPSVVTTLFPQLPKPSLAGFRIALLSGLAVVLVLGLLKLFPIALIAAALLMPLLATLYFYDVDVYEDQPVGVVLGTMAWGAVAGVAYALVARAVLPSGAALFAQSQGTLVWQRGIVLPIISLVLISVGPLVLMTRKQFNDALDGATFGAATAAAFTGASVIAYAFDALDAGLRPPGDVGLWLVRLALVAVAQPVLAMAAVGAMFGALWLHYRGPVRDRSALGRLGSPPVAVGLAAVLLIASATLQIVLPRLLALIVVALLAAVALIWARQVVHVGLLQEAIEIESMEEIDCANCGHRTRVGAFCEYCGISRAALPKTASRVQSVITPPPAGAATGSGGSETPDNTG